MSAGIVRFVAAVLVVALTTHCGSLAEEQRPDESLIGAQGQGGARVVFLPAKPRSGPSPNVSQVQLAEFLDTVLPEVRRDELEVEWHRIASDARLHSLRAGRPKGQYRLMLASWSSEGSRLADITAGYQQWCSSPGRQGRCAYLPRGQASLTSAEVYKIAFDFAMGAQWDGFIHELKGMIQPSTIRLVILTGLVVFMACIALPELTSKIPAAIATAVLTAYLGAQAVCDLVFGWIRMVREVDIATSFEQVRASGERYGQLVGAQTARILVMLAMAAVSEGGVIARLMKLPKIEEASTALAADTEGLGPGALTEVSGATVVQGEGAIAIAGAAQGGVGIAMAVRGGAPRGRATLPPRPPLNPVDIKLTYNEEWTPQQRADAHAKLEKLNKATSRTVVEKPPRAPTSASARWKARGNTVPPGCDVDHCVDLQLGGDDTLENMWPLDSSVNRSLGAKIHHAIKNLPPGTPIGKITIE